MSARTVQRPGSTPQWLPATRIGSSPRRMVQGARVFATLAAIVLAARRAG